MKTISQLQPLQWIDLPNINEVSSISEADEACLQEIKTVLQKHKRLFKFGIALLHTHFAINDDEIMLETCDVEKRTLVSKPVKKELLNDGNSIETIWRFDVEGKNSACWNKCWKTSKGHTSQHEAFPPQ